MGSVAMPNLLKSRAERHWDFCIASFSRLPYNNKVCLVPACANIHTDRIPQAVRMPNVETASEALTP